MASRIIIVLAFILGISVPIQSQPPVDFGFSQSSFYGREQGESYKVQVQFFSGGITTGFIYNLSLDLSGTASSSDVSLGTTRGRFLPSDVNEPKDVEFSLSVDNIAQESNETFVIVLHTDHFSPGATIRNRLEVVIIDSDVITFQLSESDYTQNEEPNALMEVLITKESGILLANPVYFRITPLTVGDALNKSVISEFDPENPFSPNRANYKDFNDSVIYFEFPSDKSSVEVAIPIVDDEIDEADEQVFIIFLEVVNATNLDNLNILEDRHSSIGRIIDNEIIRIGFERQSYDVTEPNLDSTIQNLVYLIRENNQTSEQTYSVDLTVGDPGRNFKPATIDVDYSLGLRGQTKQTRFFAPADDRIPFVFVLYPDLAVEGNETFQATSAQVTPSGDFPVFQSPNDVTAFANTLIHILDNDELKVGFEELNYTVSESDGTVEVCVVIISPPDDADLDVMLTLSASTIDGTAGAGSDFTELRSTSLEFPSSPGSPTAGPHRECFNVTITDDDTPENTESFSLFLQEDTFTSQTGAIISPDLTEIFILDEDEVVIGFLSDRYSVNESDGTAFIEFGVITGNLGTDISVQLRFSDGSALSGSDYISTERVYSLTGRETVTVDIGVIEDDKFEHAEVFYASLSLDAVPPRVTLQPDQTEIIIIDDEAIIFSFRASTYSFMENIGTGTVSVGKISGSTDQNITLRVSGSLIGRNQLITFSPLDSEKSITLNIPDDSIALEPPEKFTLTLTAITISDGIMLQPNDKTDITILDDDELIIGFAGGASVPESENATLSITFSSAFATDFNINIGPPKNDSLISLEIAEPDEDYFLPDFTVEAISSLHNVDSSLYFDVFIIQDEFLEYEECFVTAISLPNSVNGVVEIAGGKDTALVCIENDDRVTISFDRVMYSFNENAGSVNISASLVEGELKKTVEVLFNTLSGTATSEDPKDFQSLHRAPLQFDELMIQNEVSVTIINDNIFEDEEIFFASLVTNDAFVDFGDNATITIVDDGDEARFGFGPVQYRVREGAGSVTLIVVLLEGKLEREVNLNFSTVEGTAIASVPADYQTVTRTITFPSMTRNVSVTVTIFDDSILESTENFLVNLADPLSQNGVSIMPSTANVDIIDNDGVTIGFEHAIYSVDEGDVVEVCAVLNGTLQKSVEVSVSSSSGSATANGDYNPVVTVLTFDQANRACFNVTTVEDQTLEKTTENLNLGLSTLDRNVTLFPDQAKVSIRDNDRVRFGLRNTSLTLREEGGATARVCVIVTTGTLGRDVIVTLNTMDGTATSVDPADFGVLLNNITFTPGDNEICQNISILDDTLYEEDESFSALLSTGDSSVDIDSSQQSATIIIIDTDEITIGFTRGRDMVEEDVDNIIIICVEVKNNGMLEKSITVQLDTDDGTAKVKEDYNSTSYTLEFTPNNERGQQCRAVNILSDKDLEGTETFMAILSTGDDRVFLNPDTETIFIVDNDVVNIVFIGDPFEGRERSGIVAITVGVMDPEKLKTEVSVNLTTEGFVGISNAAKSGVDYTPLDMTLTFSETVTEITVNISLLDDNTLEGDEDFKARLSTSSGSNVGLGMNAIITIVDDDRVTFGLKNTSLSLNEGGAATARVCIIVTTGTLGRDVIVTLNTMDGTATSIDPAADFVALLKNITFTPGANEICQDISILDDTIYEEDESFSALLSTGDLSADIDLSHQNTTIIIMDTDVITIGFTRGSDMAEEDVDTTITICVEVKNNGTLEKAITLQLDTVDGTAKAKEDYNSTSYTLEFTPDERAQQCRDVNILSDDNLEGTETFNATLSTRDDRVSLNPDIETIIIVDNDVVNIVFIGAPFEGIEDSGFVAITVGVMEPDKLKTEVSVNLTTEDIVGISNAATAGVDYRRLDVTLTFSETVTVITVNIELIDDNALEGDEDFKARLSTSSGSIVGLPPDPEAIITIVDKDRVTIGFEEETIQVDENIRMKTLCVNVSHGQLERTTTVSVSSQDQTAINGQDYSFQLMTFTFSKDITQQCFNVNINDDNNKNEPKQNFLLMLTTGDPQITLSPDTATITIIDNDVAVNDTIIGDPLFTVPILVDRDQREMLNMMKPQLCYEIHGDADQWFNLVTDNCATVNALYTPLNDRLNVITKIGVKAVDDDNKCVEILVDRDQCSVSVDGTVLGMESYSSGNINVRKYSKRARISVPNCNAINLIMWVICEERTVPSSNVTGDMLKFVVLRGLNYGRRAHGLLGQFWNVPVDITPYTDPLTTDGSQATNRFIINVKGIGSSLPRSFTGWLYDLSWDHVEEPCLYVGNKQAGPIHEVATPNDGVIENIFKDYKVADAFSEENYVFGLFNCPDVGSG